MALSSAKGILALLRESDTSILHFALNRLHQLVDVYWYEITSDISVVEELYESVNLPEPTRQLAALIAARVYFHLGEYNESVNFALAAGPLFEVSKRSLFTDTILSRCIDVYVSYRDGSADVSLSGPLDPRLDALFGNLAEQWQALDPAFVNVKELVGFTLRARRLDLLEKILVKHIAATNSAEMLTFTLNSANVLVTNYAFRREILLSLSKMYTDGLQTIDYFALAQCLLFLGDSTRMAEIIHGLLVQGEKILAYQLAFDLFDFGSQEFLLVVASELERLSSASSSTVVDAKFKSALQGDVTTGLYVKFLYARCNTDVHILNNLKKSLDPKNSVTHNAAVMANSLMYAGTTIDGFLRDNMEWLSRANQWAKFTATATVGVLHKGHATEAMNILKPYLPEGNGGIGPLPFQEAGAMYALGLIHAPLGAATNATVVEYLRNALRTYNSSEQIVHGASLGLGLAAMGLHNQDLFEFLFTCVSGCDAVAGEGAALAIGMVMMGSGNALAIETLKRHAMEFDQKEKTIRGLAMAMALIMLGREDDCLPLVNELSAHADPWVRLGAVFTLGMAFAGTSNAKAIEMLLATAVRDVSDDVRRNAVTMIGFLTFKDPALCVDMTKVLADSYNPHIRYGVAMALGIAASGTARKDAVDMLWTLKDDLTDFVRQGSFIALSLVLVEATEQSVPRVKELRQILAKKIGDRKEDTCTKFGCIIATGLLDAGGRNCTILLHKQRHRVAKSVVGMFVFSQHWFWFPYTLMISLAMHPTCIIALNEDLEMPKYTFTSNAPPSMFSIPKSVQQEKKEAKASASLEKVVLSTTRKDQEQKDKLKKRASSAQLDEATPLTDGKGTADEESAGKKAEAAEPTSEALHNPARVTLQQFSVVAHDVDPRYRPLKAHAFGVCMLKDLDPTKAGAQTELVAAINPMDRDDTAPMPEPFIWP